MSKLTRREVIIAGGGVALGAAVASVGAGVILGSSGATEPTGSVEATGDHQAGIARPESPQQNGLISVFDLESMSGLGPLLAALSASILTCTSQTEFEPEVTPEGPGDLTVSIGLGPRVIRSIDDTLPGAQALPSFAGDKSIAEQLKGGDLLIAIYASDPGTLAPVLERLTADLGAIVPRWQQRGFRSPGYGTVTRNPLGYKDGIIVPNGSEELDSSVWIADGPLAGGTVCVIRRLRLAIDEFRSQSIDQQDAVIGRHRLDGSPLSGGGPDDPVDLEAKSDSGEFLIPARAHVRAAHPTFTGSPLMLRRGYAYSNSPVEDAPDDGLLFICFQNSLDVFVKTQLRIDEQDDLREYTTATASATFLILPGFSQSQPLGATLPL